MKRIFLLILLTLLLFLGLYKILTSATVPADYVIQTDPLFEKIALCESRGDLHIKNPTSTASGEFQFLWSTWYHYGIEYWGDDFYTKNIWSSDNRDLAWYVYKKYGTGDWLASKACWQQKKTS